MCLCLPSGVAREVRSSSLNARSRVTMRGVSGGAFLDENKREAGRIDFVTCVVSSNKTMVCVCVSVRVFVMCLFFEHGAGLNLTPANQAPVLFNSSGQGNLFAHLCAHGRGELKLGEIPLDGDDASAGTHGTNVEH